MVDSAVGRHARVRREEILAAAEQEFGTLGWSGARVERIADTARVNKQLIFHYFGSKAGLYAAATGALLARFDPPADAASGPVDELRLVLRTIAAASRTIPGVLFHPVPQDLEDAAAEVGVAATASWMERQRARLADAITEGQRRGHFRDDLDPAAAAGIGLALALGAGALSTTLDAAAWMADYCAWR